MQTRSLTLRFGRRVVLDGIDLTVARGSVVGYLGPNGAGKTTTTRILLRLLRPSGGEVRLLGDGRPTSAATRARIGYLPGDFAAYPSMNVTGYLSYLARLRPPFDRRSTGLLCERLRLDPLVQHEFLPLLREARDRGAGVLLSSHVMSEVAAVADAVAIVRDGRLVAADDVDRLRATTARRLELCFAQAVPLDDLRAAHGVRRVDVTGRTASVEVEGSTADLLRRAAPYGVDRVRTHEPDLAEVFRVVLPRGPGGCSSPCPRQARGPAVSGAWRAVLEQSLADLRRPVAAWSVGLSALLVAERALWPTVRDVAGLDAMLADYPEAMTEAFGLDTMSTGPGFLDAELFSLVLPLLFVALAVTWGARSFAGEEESGTLAPVLASGVSRAQVLTAKAAALLLALVALGGVVAVVTLAVSGVFGLGVGPARAFVGASAQVLLGGELGCLALAVGAATGRRAWALATATVVAVGGYVLYVAALLVDGLAGLAAWTPYDQALGAGPLVPRARSPTAGSSWSPVRSWSRPCRRSAAGTSGPEHRSPGPRPAPRVRTQVPTVRTSSRVLPPRAGRRLES